MNTHYTCSGIQGASLITVPWHIRETRPHDGILEWTNTETHNAWLRPTVTRTFYFLEPHPEELVWGLPEFGGNSFH